MNGHTEAWNRSPFLILAVRFPQYWVFSFAVPWVKFIVVVVDVVVVVFVRQFIVLLVFSVFDTYPSMNIE